MTEAYLTARRIEALQFIEPNSGATPSQRLTAWLFLKNDRKRKAEQ